jgi:hypothetical protein
MERKPPRHGAAHSAPSRRSSPAAPEGSAPGGSAPGGSVITSAVTWVRGHLIPVAVAAAAAVALVVAGVVFLVGGGKPASTASQTVGSKAASAQAATTVTKGSKWLGSSGSRQLSVVNADVAKLMAAERAGHRSAATKAAGARLAADARAALGGAMPPVAAVEYRAALQRLEAAGSAAAGGQSGPKASHLLAAGEAGLMKVTAAADAPLRLKTPAIPEPNGQ